ncbi:MAG TPA: LysM domain-containing protein [Candidatus Limnocylindria bacterium]|nr:LysM domain-containing protein [Candidatus Limnocylindria bacterium]
MKHWMAGLGWGLGLTSAAVLLARSTAPLLAALADRPERAESAVAVVALLGAWAVLAWLALGVGLTLAEVLATSADRGLEALTLTVSRAAEVVTPSALRMALHTSLRVGLAAGGVGVVALPAAPAHAAAATWSAAAVADDAGTKGWPDLDRPARPLGASGSPTPRPMPTTQPPGRYRVAAGDSLWSIAARHLPPGADASAVARAWPRWWHANRDVIGADPGLIRPGQELRRPTRT